MPNSNSVLVGRRRVLQTALAGVATVTPSLAANSKSMSKKYAHDG